MASVVQKYMKAFRLYGWKDTLAKMYSVRARVCIHVHRIGSIDWFIGHLLPTMLLRPARPSTHTAGSSICMLDSIFNTDIYIHPCIHRWAR